MSATVAHTFAPIILNLEFAKDCVLHCIYLFRNMFQDFSLEQKVQAEDFIEYIDGICGFHVKFMTGYRSPFRPTLASLMCTVSS